jgi:hypothetical protein
MDSYILYVSQAKATPKKPNEYVQKCVGKYVNHVV